MTRGQEVPFRVGEQVTGEFFTDRQAEVKRILQAMRSPSRLLVYGERRQGKSSAIRQAQVRAERDGIRVVWVDVSTVAHFGEVAQRMVASIPFRWRWREELQLRLVRAHVRVEARADPAGNPVLALATGMDPADPAEGTEHLRTIVAVLDQLAGEKKRPVVIVLDEFQEIDSVVDRGGWLIRDLMQTTHEISFVCAGSKLKLIDDLISESGPFHGFFEPLSVGPMDPAHLARWIEARMEAAGVRPGSGLGTTIVEKAGPRTQDCLQLARALYLRGAARGRVGPDEVPDVFRRAVLEDRDRFETTWANLADSHRGILRALAAGEKSLGAQGVRRRYALPSTSAISKAVRVLQERRLLSGRDPAHIDDPFFREWVLLQAMPDGTPHTT